MMAQPYSNTDTANQRLTNGIDEKCHVNDLHILLNSKPRPLLAN